jgi:HEAT repeat protein
MGAIVKTTLALAFLTWSPAASARPGSTVARVDTKGTFEIPRVPSEPPDGSAALIGLRVSPNSLSGSLDFFQPPKPMVDASLPVNALVEQFKGENVFWKQMDIAKAIVEKRDASVLPSLADWLRHEDRHIRGNVAFIFGSFGDPRGLRTFADILADRSERPEGQGIPGVPADGRYRFEQQVAADRYYAAHLVGDLRDPRGIALLVPLLDDRETQAIVPWSLGQIGDKRAIPPLLASLDNDDPSMRVLSIYALETLQATEAIPRLLALVDDNRQSHFGAGVTVSEAAKAAIAKLR